MQKDLYFSKLLEIDYNYKPFDLFKFIYP